MLAYQDITLAAAIIVKVKPSLCSRTKDSNMYLTECNCNTSGTVDGNSSCNASGQCYCATGYEGDKCDTCSNFYYVIGNTCNCKF